ncbi:M43 family zinc metalloprotease [Rapidithrix thailandica]|uniref:M43 family zinc metalloprotease n=1 Tax=Rapidithrix thailandica TaxID=413964 RepID=A0AAW9S0W9_9BACT
MTTVLLLHSIAFAQDKIKCGTDEAMEKFYLRHPEAKENAAQFELFSQNFIQSLSKQQAQEVTYIIPVVFHVFGVNQGGSIVDEDVIKNALHKLNEDFNGLNEDWNQIAAPFSLIKQTLNIEFKLARLDPQGNPTNGITFNPVEAGFGNGWGYNAKIQQYAWDNYKYMNIYVMLDLYDDGSTHNSGVAWYPDTFRSDNNLDRVVYNGRFLGYNTDENFRSVLTHEFGHWLNLVHTFDTGCNAPGDHVDDTPATTNNFGFCNTNTERCPGAGVPNGENYMDYSECYRMFTEGQVDRMLAALQHPSREPLWQPANLIATGTAPPAYCSVSNGAPNGQYIQSVSLGNLQNTNSGYETNGYSDFTHLKAKLSINTSENLSITLHASWAGTALKAWIDWNGDGTFSSNEEVLSATGQASSYTAQVTPPASAVNSTRMRIRTVYGATPTPCGNEYFSEVEDYTVFILNSLNNLNRLHSTSYSGTVTKPDKVQLTSRIYPNPLEGGESATLYLEGLQGTQQVLITILNASGVQISQQMLEVASPQKQLELDLNNYPKGMYLIKSEVQGQTITNKFLIE